MRIAFVVDGPIDQVSGGYIYDARVIDALRARGDHVEVVSLPQGSTLRRMRTNFDRRLLARLSRSDIDVIVEDELSHPGLFGLNARLRARSAVPLVALIHHLRCSEPDWAVLRSAYRLLERRFLRTVDACIYNSQATRLAVERLAGARKPFVIAPPAGNRLPIRLNEADVRRRCHAPGPLRLLFLGNLIRRKGVTTLLESLAALPEGTSSLAVVGDPTFEPGYASAAVRHAARLGLTPRVEWLGPLYDEALAKRLSISHVLVVPSEYEGFGIAYLEGMGFGLPAIATTAGGAAEVVRDGENGFLVPPGDAPALARCLRRLCEDRSYLEELSLGALHSYASRPTWEQTAESIRRFLADRLAASHPAARFKLKEEAA